MSADPFIEEIIELHEFLSSWLTGQVPNGDGKPQRLERVLADDFKIIYPNGRSGTRTDAVRGFAAAWNEKPPTYVLRVANIHTRMLGPDHCLTTYEEWHEGEPGRGRISTALLHRHSTTGTIEWLFLQETSAPHIEPIAYHSKRGQ